MHVYHIHFYQYKKCNFIITYINLIIHKYTSDSLSIKIWTQLAYILKQSGTQLVIKGCIGTQFVCSPYFYLISN
jgi:hypothetical protein